ncbi:LOW QUALITY PROTEIN: hypothetical protein NC651_015584 [Populus alba x Populus x berolinensis]|nr:LOW QUALITY PROTEIN: hypothetical protein NC651_015584 [Populus alba x Populus x berolinensis]
MMSSKSSSLIKRVTPMFTSWIRQNHRLLSSSALREASSLVDDSIHLTDNCIRRLKELQTSEGSAKDKMLRLGVETGGCSGFQYVFDLDDKTSPDDRVFETEGVRLVVDNISYDFLKGATVDYVEELIRAAFIVAANPSAVGGCSCKSSFMVKQLLFESSCSPDSLYNNNRMPFRRGAPLVPTKCVKYGLASSILRTSMVLICNSSALVSVVLPLVDLLESSRMLETPMRLPSVKLLSWKKDPVDWKGTKFS